MNVKSQISLSGELAFMGSGGALNRQLSFSIPPSGGVRPPILSSPKDYIVYFVADREMKRIPWLKKKTVVFPLKATHPH